MVRFIDWIIEGFVKAIAFFAVNWKLALFILVFIVPLFFTRPDRIPIDQLSPVSADR
jgi:hypothetical protein